eukprot:CAMPEP_0182418656 /NCGR_PEP_ID=MMETSP1167-20130531/3024_1 /TAXON_ID=2988 /ORGANISM="Mallomonas Sp, Strain CCMP3275" /LENGTH=478 /DNA_ID=CAMNT_0024592955 /DNA_START=444 /DNA_END=1880 /DNA_ORIENTATION=-
MFYGNAGSPPSLSSDPVTTLSPSPPSSLSLSPLATHARISPSLSHIQMISRLGEREREKLLNIDIEEGEEREREREREAVTRVALHFVVPEDDGGYDILGYHVYARHILKSDEEREREMSSSLYGWVWQGTVTHRETSVEHKKVHVLDVKNLLPGCAYQFKVIPYNLIGAASLSLSPSSNSISTGDYKLREDESYPSEAVYTLYGRGHEYHHSKAHITPDHTHPRHHAYIDEREREREREREGEVEVGVLSSEEGEREKERERERGNVSSLLLMVDDVTQIVSVLPSLEKSTKHLSISLHAWASHHSPHLFSVHAQAVWTAPDTAHTSLVNEREVRGRIAVVERGKVPLVFKARHAQDAGALAVLIIDNGQCVTFDQQCVPGSEKRRRERWGAIDTPAPWASIRIPVLLLLRSESASLLHYIGLDSPGLERERDKKREREWERDEIKEIEEEREKLILAEREREREREREGKVENEEL